MTRSIGFVGLLALVLLWSAPRLGFAQTVTEPRATAVRAIDVQVKAHGPTAEMAARRAIADALRQANAARLTDSSRAKRFEDSLTDLDRALAAPEMTLATIVGDIARTSRGLVVKASVLDNRELAGTASGAQPERQVTLLVSVAPFEERLASRRTIAVMPFRTASGSFVFGDATVSGDEIARRLQDIVLERLVQSNVLTVLDRQNVEAVSKERNFVESFGRTPAELARFGRMLGADLLLVGSIETAGLEITTQTVQASGYTFARAFAGMSVATRMIDVETGVIVWADTVRSALDNSQLTRMFPGGRPDASGTLTSLTVDTAESLVGTVVETVAPIKVALVDGDSIWLNRGTGRTTPGMRLLVRGGEREVLDPDTGESLGQAERTIAVIEVVSVDQRKSQARFIEGTLQDVRAGQIARPLAR
jgi:curli biogenesis system outer membrane secretion channel CsgG